MIHQAQRPSGLQFVSAVQLKDAFCRVFTQLQ